MLLDAIAAVHHDKGLCLSLQLAFTPASAGGCALSRFVVFGVRHGGFYSNWVHTDAAYHAVSRYVDARQAGLSMGLRYRKTPLADMVQKSFSHYVYYARRRAIQVAKDVVRECLSRGGASGPHAARRLPLLRKPPKGGGRAN